MSQPFSPHFCVPHGEQLVHSQPHQYMADGTVRRRAMQQQHARCYHYKSHSRMPDRAWDVRHTKSQPGAGATNISDRKECVVSERASRFECLCLSLYLLRSFFVSTTNNTLCVTQTLNNLQSADGTLTISMIMSLISGGVPQSLNKSSVACTNCNKASYNLIKQQPALLGNTTTASLQNTCGASFVGQSRFLAFSRQPGY